MLSLTGKVLFPSKLKYNLSNIYKTNNILLRFSLGHITLPVQLVKNRRYPKHIPQNNFQIFSIRLELIYLINYKNLLFRLQKHFRKNCKIISLLNTHFRLYSINYRHSKENTTIRLVPRITQSQTHSWSQLISLYLTLYSLMPDVNLQTRRSSRIVNHKSHRVYHSFRIRLCIINSIQCNHIDNMLLRELVSTSYFRHRRSTICADVIPCRQLSQKIFWA